VILQVSNNEWTYYNALKSRSVRRAHLTLIDTGVAGYRINPTFGQITTQRNSPRNMQMMLRYQF